MKVRIIKDSAEPWYDFALITDIEDGIEVSVSGKACTKCHCFLPLTAYNKGNGSFGKHVWCRECQNAHHHKMRPSLGLRKSRLKNEIGRECCRCERFLEWIFFSNGSSICKECKCRYDNEYHVKNKAEISINRKEKYQSNPNYYKEKARQWGMNNARRVKQNARLWKVANPALVKANHQRRRALKRGAPRGTPWTAWYADIKSKLTYRCYWCRGLFPTKAVDIRRILTVDHLTPLKRHGIDGLENVVACCVSCNSTKRDKTHDEFVAWLIQHEHPAWV